MGWDVCWRRLLLPLILLLGAGCDTVEDGVEVFEVPVLTPDLVVTPLEVVLGAVGLNDEERIRLTVSNEGDALLDVAAVEIVGSAAFTLVNPATSFVLRPDERTDLVVAYRPASSQTQMALLRITSDDPEEPVVEVSLVGAGTNLVSNDVRTDLHLVDTNAPPDSADYIVRGLLRISAELTIDPGVRIDFLPGSGLQVDETGSLQAVGTSDAPIVLTGTVPTPGHWRGLIVQSSSGRNQLVHVDVAYAGGRSQTTALAEAGVVVRSGAHLVLRQSRLWGSGDDGLVIEPGARLPDFEAVQTGGHRGAPIRLPASLVGSVSGGLRFGAPATAGPLPDDPVSEVVEVVADEIVQAATWRPLGRAYRVSGTIDVRAPFALAAGVELRFAADGGLRVRRDGSLDGAGTEAQPVVLSGDRAVPGYWRGVLVASNDPLNRLVHTHIFHGGGRPQVGKTQAAGLVVESEARLRLQQSRVQDSGATGLLVERGAHLDAMQGNTFVANDGPAIELPVGLLSRLDATQTFDDSSFVRALPEAIRTPQTWDMPVPVHFEGVARLEAAVRVLAGFEAMFGSQAGWVVAADGGALRVEGTADEPVRLIGRVAAPGYWRGVLVQSNDPANQLDHVDIAHGGGRPHDGQVRAAGLLLQDGARLRLTQSTIRESGAAGLLISPGSRLDGFAANTFAANEGPAIDLPASAIGRLDAETTFADGAYVAADARPVTVAQTWTVRAPVHFRDLLRLEAPVRLEAGFRGRFEAQSGWIIAAEGGALTAAGTAADPVRLDGLVATPGYWRGIRFLSNNPLNQLTHTVIAHGGGLPYEPGGTAGNVRIDPLARVGLEQVRLMASGEAGLLVEPGGVLTAFAENEFVENVGTPVRLPVALLGVLDDASRYAEGNGQPYIHVVAGAATQPATWARLDAPYRFVGATTLIEAAVTLAPGTQLLFALDAGLHVRREGALTAVGTADAPIRFTADTAVLGSGARPGHWRGLVIDSAAPANELEHTVVEYGGGLLYGDTMTEANVYVNSRGRLRYARSVNRYSEDWGLYVEDGAVVDVSGNSYTGNPDGDERLPAGS